MCSKAARSCSKNALSVNLPGRKSDVKDAEWIATLLRHGLLEHSYIPEKTIRDLREFSRLRRVHEPPHQPGQLLPAGAELFPVYGRLLRPALDDTSFHHVFVDVQTFAYEESGKRTTMTVSVTQET